MRGKILIVDDDASIRGMLQLMLEFEGFQTASASNGSEALERLESEPPPDLILLDLMMPVMDGWRFLELIEARPDLREIPVIVLTATSPHQINVSDRPVLNKPVDYDQLLEAIAALKPLRRSA